jgi:hypothetical protein
MLEEEELKDAILLVFANKQDQRGALNARHVRATLSHHSCYILLTHLRHTPRPTIAGVRRAGPAGDQEQAVEHPGDLCAEGLGPVRGL